MDSRVRHLTLLMFGWEPDAVYDYVSPKRQHKLNYDDGAYTFYTNGRNPECGLTFEAVLEINPLNEAMWNGTVSGRFPSSPNIQNCPR